MEWPLPLRQAGELPHDNGIVSTPIKNYGDSWRPKIKDDDVVFTRANKAQRNQLLEYHAQLWSAPLTLRDYLYVQYIMRRAGLDKNRVEHYVLHPYHSADTILAGCIVHIRDAFIAPPRPADNPTGSTSTRVASAVITGVYTPPQHRTRGLATVLLRRIQEELDGRTGYGKIEFSVLYSDPHTDFFRGLGWQPQRTPQLRLTLDPDAERIPYPPDDMTRPLYWADVEEEAARDRRRAALGLGFWARDPTATYAHLDMSSDTAKWHILREALYLQKLGRPRAGTHGGASTCGSVAPMASAWWVRDLVRRRLLVGRVSLRGNPGLEAHLAGVLQMAAAEAGVWGLREVVVWDPTMLVVRAAKMLVERSSLSMAVEERPDMVPCLRPHGRDGRNLVWQAKEYYAWC